MRQDETCERRPHGRRGARTDAPIKAARWRARLGMLACTAALWQGPAAMAEVLLVETPATSSWMADQTVDAPGLPVIYAAESTFAQTPHLLPGVARANDVHLAWEVQTDQAPGGGGSLRSAGNMDTTQSMIYTLDNSTATQARLQTAGLSQTTGQWTFYDGSGNFITDTPAQERTIGVLSIWMRLTGPADLRFSGLMWSTAASGSFSGWLAYDEDGIAPKTDLFVRDAFADPASFEYQWRLPGPGLLHLYLSDHSTQLMPCCNTAFSGSSGWELTLEASAVSAVPEPASAGLLLAGIAALGRRRRALAKQDLAMEPQP